jgi:hypothetical protein
MKTKGLASLNRAAIEPRRWSLALFALIGLAFSPVSGEPPTASSEYKVKAAFLFNFAQFVEWPVKRFADAKAPIVIGILGDDDFGPFLDELTQYQTVASRPLAVRRSRTVEDLTSCHILFVSRSEEGRNEPILATLADVAILTVGEVKGFAERGGTVNFFLEGGRLRFEVNTEAVRRAGLKVASQVLRLARIVGADPGKERP